MPAGKSGRFNTKSIICVCDIGLPQRKKAHLFVVVVLRNQCKPITREAPSSSSLPFSTGEAFRLFCNCYGIRTLDCLR